jgi:crotonobetainyl-CoA:carnitine CoA-transferase CaiB-like acyl-CoA transferase
MKEPVHDPEAVAKARALEAQLFETDISDVLGASQEARPCPAPVRPGAHNAAAARRLGCEDEWIDRMKNRYGEEW